MSTKKTFEDSDNHKSAKEKWVIEEEKKKESGKKKWIIGEERKRKKDQSGPFHLKQIVGLKGEEMSYNDRKL